MSTFALSIRETTSCDERNDVSPAEKRRNAHKGKVNSEK